MKVTLVSPNERKILSNAGDRMPLGLLYISSSLTANGIDNDVVDLNHTPYLEFVDKVRKERPDAVGLSCISSPSVPQIQHLAKVVRPYTGRIIVGGFHPTVRPQDLSDLVDCVVLGAGEEGILDAINSTTAVQVKKHIDVNKYPIPDRTKLPDKKYKMELLGLKIAGMVTSRGCPFSCSFCGNVNKTLELRDKHNIDQEVRQLKSMGYEAVYFYNESHTVNKQHAVEVGEIMKRHKMKYRLETRANLINDDIAKMLSDTGCMMVALGIESGDDKVLDAINKGEHVEDYRKAIDVLSRHGIPTKGYFIMGLPEQDLASGLRSIELAKEFHTKGMIMADFYTLTPFPGSPIAANPDKYGVKVLHTDYKKYLEAGRKEINPVVETNWLSREGIKSLVNRARLEWRN